MTPPNDWICEDGHPLYLIDGDKVCSICQQIAEHGARPGRCRLRGHTVPKNSNNCRACRRYREAPWFEELDATGSAVCPSGHHMTHENLAYGLRGGVWPERKCSQCVTEGWQKAHAAFMRNRESVAAAEGREVRRRSVPKVRLPSDYIDWVVALRLIEGKVDEVYEMKRGKHIGATAMEKWVAFHSTADSDIFERSCPGGVTSVRYQWREYGDRHKWKPKTLAQAMAEL